jgi:ubiquinone/menaquinone biosynthesis C-methylase UbiE
MKTAPSAGLLFDSKAQSWESKYRPQGPLAFRIDVFSAMLAGQAPSGGAILDFGGGTGAIASALARSGFRLTVCDLSEQMIAAGKQLHAGEEITWRLLPRDWKRLPFAARSFDAVIASSVFEYLDDVDGVLTECRRVLNPGGKLFFSIPNPAHLSRKIERCLRPLAVFALRIPLVGALPKVGNYLKYLEISRSRFSAAEWRQKAARAGWRPLAVELDPSHLAANPALLYLAFEAAGN